MLSEDKLKVTDVNYIIDDLRLELCQFGDKYYEDEDELNEKIDLLEQILDLCGSYLEL